MSNKKNIYKTTITFLIFIAFFGFVISDLVEMHLRVIYDVVLLDNNGQFLKPSKDDNHDLTIINCCKSPFKDTFSVFNKTCDFKIFSFEIYLHKEEIILKEVYYHTEYFQLRAPPIS